MELSVNTPAPLTRWLAREGLLSTPFVLIDVGVQGGIHPRWLALGSSLHVYGFDPLEEAVAELSDHAPPNHHYFAMALGAEDGQRSLSVQKNRYASSFYQQSRSQFAVAPEVYEAEQSRVVPIRRLDGLFTEKRVPPADFIKMDCEGFEPEIVKGAESYFAASDLLGADVETNFNVSPILPETHFWATYQPLLRRRLLLFDAAFNRVPRAHYANRFAAADPKGRFRPATWNVLFARNLGQELESPESFPGVPPRPIGVDTVLKSLVIMEVYGLLDWTFDLLVTFRDLLRTRMDVDEAVDILAPKIPRAARSPWQSVRKVARRIGARLVR